MSSDQATVICFKGRKIYVHLRESKKQLIENAIRVFTDIGVSDVPQTTNKLNLYVVIDGKKVFFGCESGCEDSDKCVCCWKTIKPSGGRTVYLESKVEVKRWYVRLPLRMFEIISKIMPKEVARSTSGQTERAEVEPNVADRTSGLRAHQPDHQIDEDRTR
ncbi:hypothetical protein K435DRAFT_869855 [Dendrothele bispora CBS 962.96]|uniref:Uncharacterized protein n=1 Tax=Dendrothele bispora (strain CBS 962.96) TaxID=1314807 RepID=A0A4S8L9G4_DENBC|nr:hypothetical protein K435DRAFT_869855 [Dendrothele bispora CBS 962.96]